ncbi:MAG TPA: hypothetical protein VMA83_04595 [Solirubrobacteraceae bacterium]|nr:hypothetical protein [Solirubrobacteraceae bacterium]
MPATTYTSCNTDLLVALAAAATYGATEPVEVHETRASLVFLAGDRAFKLQKPLALGFLGYSTLARRRSAAFREFGQARSMLAEAERFCWRARGPLSMVVYGGRPA